MRSFLNTRSEDIIDAKPDHNPKASAKLFHAFAGAGKKLADLHVNYESAKEFPLKRQENKG